MEDWMTALIVIFVYLTDLKNIFGTMHWHMTKVVLAIAGCMAGIALIDSPLVLYILYGWSIMLIADLGYVTYTQFLPCYKEKQMTYNQKIRDGSKS